MAAKTRPRTSPTERDRLVLGGRTGRIERTAYGLAAILVAASLMMAITLSLNAIVEGLAGSPAPRAWPYQWAMHVLATTAVAVTWAPVAWLARRQRWWGAALAAVIMFPIALSMGNALASGAWISQQSFAWMVRVGPALAAAVGLAAFAAASATWAPDGERRRLAYALTAASLIASIVFAVADALVMRGLHAAFHLFFHGVATLFLLVALRRVGRPLLRFGRTNLAMSGITCVAIVGSSLAWLRMPPPIRGQLLMRSPIAGHALRTFTWGSGARLGDTLAADGEFQTIDAAALPRGLIETGDDWNVVWIVVDTLRADALPPVREPGAKFAAEDDTPFLNEWISSSFRFERAYAQASATHWSIPAMFRSAEGFENPETVGIPLPTYMDELGRRPLAVVNHMFIEPHGKAAHRAGDRLSQLTATFDELATYDEDDNAALLPLFEQQLDEVGSQPFFAWVHFFNMHDPGYAGRELGRKDGSWNQRYKLALGWLDTQLAELMAELERRGIADRTIVILSSDHGEHLGQHGTANHGRHVFEEVIRVPLIIHVPGAQGRSIPNLVSNVDILPTLADLLGAPIEPMHRGFSLVPLMLGAVDDWDRTIYATNWDGQSAAVVHDSDKLIYDSNARIFLRFDLADDPGELHSIFDEQGGRDSDLRLSLLNLNPSLFAADLQQPEQQHKIEAKLRALDPRVASPILSPLLRVIAVAPTRAMLDETERIFLDAPDERTRAEILSTLFPTDKKRWTRRYRERLAQLEGKPGELEFVEALALLGQPAIGPKTTAEHMRYWAENGMPDEWMPWLRLVQRWKGRRASDYREPLVMMLRRASDDPRATVAVRRAILASLASLQWKQPDPELAAFVAEFSQAQDSVERKHAIAVLGRVGSRADLAVLDALRMHPELRARVAALDAAVRIAPAEAEPRLLSHADDEEMVFALVPRLGEYGTADSVPFLRKAQRHERSWVRSRAKSALKQVEARIGKPVPMEGTPTIPVSVPKQTRPRRAPAKEGPAG